MSEDEDKPITRRELGEFEQKIYAKMDATNARTILAFAIGVGLIKFNAPDPLTVAAMAVAGVKVLAGFLSAWH